VFCTPSARPAHADPANSATAVKARPFVLTATTPQASRMGTAALDPAAAATASASMPTPVEMASSRIGRIRLPTRSDQ
jgi:hypothetical protein